jgi:hypothetical protein
MVIFISHHSKGHSRLARYLVALIEHPDAQSAAGNDRARVGFSPTGKQANEGGFSVTVSADNPDSVPVVEAKSDGL